MVIAAALSIQDPRERPADAREAADAAHARFADPDSDFLGYLRLWNDLREEQAARSTNQFRKMCRAGFLNYRVREWQDLRSAAPGHPRPGHDRELRAGRARRDPHRAARRAARTWARGTPPPGLPRGAWRPVQHLPRISAVPQAAALGDGGRARRDHPAVGPHRRPDRAGVGRGVGRAPGQAQLQRAALGRRSGRGPGLREGDAVRRGARAVPSGRVRAGGPGGLPRAVHPARAGRGRLAQPPRVPPAQPRPGRGGPGPGGPRPASGRWSTGTHVRGSTTSGWARWVSRAGFRQLVEGGRRSHPTCWTSAVTCCWTTSPARCQGDTPTSGSRTGCGFSSATGSSPAARTTA
jgi:hypothetical protein